MPAFDCAIVASSISGLEVGALLAHDGARVCVLEPAPATGEPGLGIRSTVRERDGFVLDGGVHVVHYGARSALGRIARHLGWNLGLRTPGTSYVVDVDGEVKVFPTTRETALHTDLFTTWDRIEAGLHYRRITNGTEDVDALLRTSLEAWLRARAVPAGLRRFYEITATAMLVCPFPGRASAGALLGDIREVLRTGSAAVYPEGGWRGVRERLAQTVRARGGEVRATPAWPRVAIADGRVTGLHEDGAAAAAEGAEGAPIVAERYVLDVPLQRLGAVLPEGGVPSGWLSRCTAARPTAGVLLQIALDAPITQDTGWWYWYAQKAYGLFVSNVEPSVAPAGRQLLTVFRPCAPEEMADPVEAAWLERDLREAVRRTFPEMAGATRWIEARRLTHVDSCEVNVEQTRLDRPGAAVPGVANLWLAGDGLACEGAGGDLAHANAMACYATMTGKSV